jgi:hypothetical protein
MGQYELKQDEEWILRRLDELCPVAGPDSAVTIEPQHWEQDSDVATGVAEMVRRMSLADCERHLGNLVRLGLVAGQEFVQGGGAFHITPEGKQYVRRLDNPDLVERVQQWARRHRPIAWAIIVAVVLGVIGGLLQLLLNILSLARSLMAE